MKSVFKNNIDDKKNGIFFTANNTLTRKNLEVI